MSDAEAIRPIPPTAPTPSRLWLATMGLAAGFGLVAFLAGEAALRTWRPASRLVTSFGVTMDIPSFDEVSRADKRNATLGYAILGGSLALGLGVAGGLARRSAVGTVAGGLVGLILGPIAAAGAATATLPIYYRQLDVAAEELGRDLTVPLAVHGGIGLAVGLAGGLAMAVGLGSKGRAFSALLGGAVGGAIGAVVYEVVGALAFPGGKTSQPVGAIWPARLIMALSVCLLAGALAAFAVAAPERRPRKTVNPPVEG